MLNKKINIILFAIVVFIQLAIVSYIALNSEQILNNGKTIKMKLEPVDPVDPFRGHYIFLNFENTIEVKNNNNWLYRQPCFAIMEEDSNGFYVIKDITKTEPVGDIVYFKSFVRNIGGNDSTKLSVHIPFNRFYMEENKAKEIDKIMRNANRDSLNTYIIIKYKDGELLVKDLIVEKL